MSFSTVNERTIKTDAVQKEGYEAYNMVDGKLDTYFASGTEGGYIEYTINKEVGDWDPDGLPIANFNLLKGLR